MSPVPVEPFEKFESLPLPEEEFDLFELLEVTDYFKHWFFVPDAAVKLDPVKERLTQVGQIWTKFTSEEKHADFVVPR